jgi:hypothetical protein
MSVGSKKTNGTGIIVVVLDGEWHAIVASNGMVTTTGGFSKTPTVKSKKQTRHIRRVDIRATGGTRMDV